MINIPCIVMKLHMAPCDQHHMGRENLPTAHQWPSQHHQYRLYCQTFQLSFFWGQCHQFVIRTILGTKNSKWQMTKKSKWCQKKWIDQGEGKFTHDTNFWEITFAIPMELFDELDYMQS
jgi:hypothetical protein